PTIDYIRKRTPLNVDEICAILFGIQCSLKVTENVHWIIDLPKPVATNVSRTVNGSKGYFIHVTDIHADANYALGSCGQCDRIMCCQNSSDKCTGEAVAGNWADYRRCDMQLEVVDYDAKFMLLTGDYVPHNIWEVTVEEVQFYFPFRIFPTLGNHEAVPVNWSLLFRFIAPSQVKNEMNSTWLHEHIAEQWKPLLSEAALKTLAK
ncbi:sphingomyelin phosphodiesterase-like protein 2, partial [Leptotrombidium deliense]